MFDDFLHQLVTSTSKSCNTYSMLPFSATLSDRYFIFQGHGLIDALDVLCAQLTPDLFAIAKFF